MYVPDGQLWQNEAPRAPEKEPAEQRTQSEGDTDPVLFPTKPASHREHWLEPSFAAYVPGAQTEHVPASVCPLSALAVPALQGWQASAELLPLVGLKVPGRQAIAAVAPAKGQYPPALQGVQSALEFSPSAVENEPNGQAEQRVEFGSAAKKPAPQIPQDSRPPWPGKELAVPRGHGAQPEAKLVAPLAVP